MARRKKTRDRSTSFVLGGGSYGPIFAQHLLYQDTSHSHRILVLEGGPFSIPEHVQNLPMLGLGVPGPTTVDQGVRMDLGAFVPLERDRTIRRGRAPHYRFYDEYRLPAGYATEELRVRLHGNAEDARRGLNRAEHLRAIPPSDPDFVGLNRRRPDAEARHRTLKDTLWPLGRAQSVGHVAQDADLLGFGLGMNALVWHRNRWRRGPPTLA